MQLRTRHVRSMTQSQHDPCHAFAVCNLRRQNQKQTPEQATVTVYTRRSTSKATASELRYVPSNMSQHGGLGDTARRWRELHGGDNSWTGLLDPLDLDLRRTVLRYGEMAQATYDAFNCERASPHAGLSRFARARFFDRARLPAHAAAYRVTRFLYATSSVAVPAAFMLWSVAGSRRRCRESNWIGYVAAATDEGKAALGRRDIVVAWRGTVEALEWADARRPRVPHGADGRPPRGRRRLRRHGAPRLAVHVHLRRPRVQPQPGQRAGPGAGRGAEAGGRVQGRGAQRHRDGPQPRRGARHAQRVRHRRQRLQRGGDGDGRLPRDRVRVRQPARRRRWLQEAVRRCPGAAAPPRPQRPRRRAQVPGRVLPRRRRGARGRHGGVAVPEEPRARADLPQPRGVPARRGGHARRARRVRARRGA
ncbi:uncharacterized LOC100273423 [Zea mays]|uniref:Phospholipase A1 n=2 Tax=Zea mays TaxID=4577 RepID=B4FVF4_MAIZE|nr:uncharacterized LOC100273423 [Zea mays]ACF86097.1 unknown [Zea mays]|eukprot:NP_001141332.1 uncharacterized LOC100273423 [Zea mays]